MEFSIHLKKGVLAKFLSHHENFMPFACLKISYGLSDIF